MSSGLFSFLHADGMRVQRWGEVRVCVSVCMLVFIYEWVHLCMWVHMHVCVEAKADAMSLSLPPLCLL